MQKEVNKSDASSKGNKVGLLQNYLSTMKSGTKVFQHFLSSSNLSQILEGKTPLNTLRILKKIKFINFYRYFGQLHNSSSFGFRISTMASN